MGKALSFGLSIGYSHFLFANLIPINQRNNINWEATVKDFITGHKWDKVKLLRVLDWEIVKQIIGIPIPSGNQKDQFVWGPAANAIRWLPPPDRTLKINFEGSVSNTSAASGVIFRDSEGNPVFASSRNLGITSAPIAEATALRDGLINAKAKGYTDIQVEGDSKMVIEAVNENISSPWRIKQIVQDIKKIAKGFSTISFKHIYREANFAADAIASTRHQTTEERVWENNLLRRVTRCIQFDNLGTGCLRGNCL
uniref:uncharacterized protein LOC105350886 n=1 Tax=Fragaria vesca subsp. vesca TaxID=101020 RepID=UPI0005C8745C|nr:PREDICTED: uncharacterized protein LOC105350886 [Fragaria vesca subsp. vesca]